MRACTANGDFCVCRRNSLRIYPQYQLELVWSVLHVGWTFCRMFLLIFSLQVWLISVVHMAASSGSYQDITLVLTYHLKEVIELPVVLRQYQISHVAQHQAQVCMKWNVGEVQSQSST